MLNDASELEPILSYLRGQRGVDFSGYKPTTLLRRTRREMTRVGAETVGDYLDHLQVSPGNVDELFNSLWINVTSFFRDQDTWDDLRQSVLPIVLEEHGEGPLRVWSAGCATGQEPYSLAIVLADHFGAQEFREKVKIYATDIDEEALTQARQAVYTAQQLEGLDAEQRSRYFEPISDDRYAFRPDLRRSVVFGRNNLLQDPPMSRIDLLACRNTLMYFNAPQQRQILERLHFALAPRGVLLLGKAETLVSHDGLFVPLDGKRRFFRKQQMESRDQPFLLSTPPGSKAPLPGSDNLRLLARALQESPVAHLVLDRAGRLVMRNAKAVELFDLTGNDLGRPVLDMELSFRPADLRPLLLQVRAEHEVTRQTGVEWNRPGQSRQVLDVEVTPLMDCDGVLSGISVAFSDVTRPHQLQDDLKLAQRRLQTAYEELQSTNEELETTNEELQSTVEELETTNEELQSSNEELATMNEELQSVNDELYARDADQRTRTAEANRLNSMLGSVLTTLGAGVFVVDTDEIVRMWNSTAEDLWGVREDEAVGQSFGSLDIGLPTEEVKPYIDALLARSDPGDRYVDAINRRGRQVRVRITGRTLVTDEDERTAIVITTEVQKTESSPASA